MSSSLIVVVLYSTVKRELAKLLGCVLEAFKLPSMVVFTNTVTAYSHGSTQQVMRILALIPSLFFLACACEVYSMPVNLAWFTRNISIQTDFDCYRNMLEGIMPRQPNTTFQFFLAKLSRNLISREPDAMSSSMMSRLVISMSMERMRGHERCVLCRCTRVGE